MTLKGCPELPWAGSALLLEGLSLAGFGSRAKEMGRPNRGGGGGGAGSDELPQAFGAGLASAIWLAGREEGAAEREGGG